MQEILEAYRTLSDPEKRRQYDLELGGGKAGFSYFYGRRSRSRKKKRKREKKESDSFVTYWNAACKLNEIVNKSCHLEEQASRRASLPMKVLRKIGKTDRVEQEIEEQLSDLSLQAVQYITILKMPEFRWNTGSRDNELGSCPLGAKSRCRLSHIICKI